MPTSGAATLQSPALQRAQRAPTGIRGRENCRTNPLFLQLGNSTDRPSKRALREALPDRPRPAQAVPGRPDASAPSRPSPPSAPLSRHPPRVAVRGGGPLTRPAKHGRPGRVTPPSGQSRHPEKTPSTSSPPRRPLLAQNPHLALSPLVCPRNPDTPLLQPRNAKRTPTPAQRTPETPLICPPPHPQGPGTLLNCLFCTPPKQPGTPKNGPLVPESGYTSTRNLKTP